jgi:hypothetical protein
MQAFYKNTQVYIILYYILFHDLLPIGKCIQLFIIVAESIPPKITFIIFQKLSLNPQSKVT